MNRTLLVLTLLSGLATLAKASAENSIREFPEDTDPDNRQLTGNGITFTVGYASFIFGVTSLIALGVLLALSYFYATGDGSGYSGYSGADTGSSYSSYGRKS